MSFKIYLTSQLLIFYVQIISYMYTNNGILNHAFSIEDAALLIGLQMNGMIIGKISVSSPCVSTPRLRHTEAAASVFFGQNYIFVLKI